MPSDTVLVPAIAIVVAVVCFIAIVIVAIKQKRRTGNYPQELSDKSNGNGKPFWGFLIPIISLNIPDHVLRKLPFSVLIPGVDSAVLVMGLIMAACGISYSFGSKWNKQIYFYQIYMLIFFSICGLIVFRDIQTYDSMRWVWAFAPIVAIPLIPLAARLVYKEFYSQSSPESPSVPRIYRPGDF